MRLYPETETQFDTNGIGVLADAVSCIVTEERNGAFELELQYPVDGIHFAQLRNRCVILAAPNPVDDEQPFRIYKISKPMGGIVTVNAEHISYDLSGIALMPFEAVGVADALSQFVTKAVTSNPFTFHTDKSSGGNFSVRVPQSIRACMGGREGSLLDVYGGEYRYDRFRVSLLNARGQNNGVSIRYGKNLTDLTQEENIAGVYTAAYPFWTSEEDYLELPERLVTAPGTYAYTRILTLDLSQEFQEKPTVEQLRTRAQSYVEQNKIGVPSVSIQVSFVPLEQTEEYKNIALLERVMLCDTVNVQFDALGVDATAKCVKTVYNVLKQRYDSVLLGDAKATIADTILEQKKEISKAPTVTAMQAAILSATKLITGNSGGYVVLHSSTGASAPDEILIMDTPDIATAKKVWRWNNAGFGYSSKGYNGPYGLAITQDGAFVADFITAGTLNAAQLKVINLIADSITSGVLKSKSGDTIFDLDTGVITFGGENTLMGYAMKAMTTCWTNGIQCRLNGSQKYGYAMGLSKRGDVDHITSYIETDVVSIKTGSVVRDAITGCYGDQVRLWGDMINGRAVSWEWDGNRGKFILTGL